jgi:hypothetical protein
MDTTKAPISQQSRMFAETTTKQGCSLNVITLKRQDENEGLSYAKTLYHLGWYTGLENVQMCQLPDYQGGLPLTGMPIAPDPTCRMDNALQGRMTVPPNLPVKNVNSHYLSSMDSRAAYAILGSPGGDMGEFILGLAALEKLMGWGLSPTVVNDLLREYIGTMTTRHRWNKDTKLDRMSAPGYNNNPTEKPYFYMNTDMDAKTAWYKAAGIEGKNSFEEWNPLDEKGRRRLLKLSTKPDHIGCPHLKLMVEDGNKYEVRKMVVESAIQSFLSIFYDPFDPLREHLLFPVLTGEKGKAMAVVNIQSPEHCHPLSPLVVPKLHTVSPSGAGDLLKIGGEKDESESAQPGFSTAPDRPNPAGGSEAGEPVGKRPTKATLFLFLEEQERVHRQMELSLLEVEEASRVASKHNHPKPVKRATRNREQQLRDLRKASVEATERMRQMQSRQGNQKKSWTEKDLFSETNRHISELTSSQNGNSLRDIQAAFMEMSESEGLNRKDPPMERGTPDKSEGSQVLINHYVASALFRRNLAKFLAPHFDVDTSLLLAKMNRMATAGFLATANSMASGKPHYVASFMQ